MHVKDDEASEQSSSTQKNSSYEKAISKVEIRNIYR